MKDGAAPATTLSATVYWKTKPAELNETLSSAISSGTASGTIEVEGGELHAMVSFPAAWLALTSPR